MTEGKQVTEDFHPQETRRILKNVVIIGAAFMLHFTAYGGAAILQSSINAEAGLGTASLAAVYAGFTFSCIFLPASIIKWFGTKWAICLSFVTYMPYIVAQFYPTFYTLVPAGLLVGLGAGPLWCAKDTYLSVVSDAYSRIKKVPSDVILPRFLGLFFMIFQVNIGGNLISSFLLSSGDNAAAHTALNATTIPELCGANFRPNVDAGQALQQQPRDKILMLNGIYLAFMVGAVIIVGVGVDSMKRYDSVRDGIERLSGMDLLSATLKLMVEPKHMMLIILNIFVGYEQAFLEADFTAAFVSCIIGTGSVGFVMMTFGLTNAIGCLITGYIVKMTGRVPVICSSAAVLTTLMVALLVWRPQEGQAFVIYAIAVIWGFCDSVWRVHITAFGRTLLPGREEALFSNFSLWGSVGFIVAYVSSPYLRTSEKTYFMLAAMIVGVTLYCILEYRERGTKEINFDKEVPTESGCINKGFQSSEL